MIIQKTVHFKDGLHSRNAMLLAELARKHDGDLKIVSKNGVPLNIDCRSIISILLGQILENDQIELETNSTEVKNELDKLFQ